MQRNLPSCSMLLLLLSVGLLGHCGCMMESTDWVAKGNSRYADATTQPAMHSPEHIAKASSLDYAAFEGALNQLGDLQYAQAEQTLQSLLPRFEQAGDTHYAGQTLFWLGYCAEKLSRREQALSYYHQVIRRYPDSHATRLARQRRDELEMR